MAQAFEKTTLVLDWPSAADLTAKQFYAVQLNTSEQVDISDATVRNLGVLQNAPNTGQDASVCLLGVSRMIVDGSGTAIAAMDALAPNSSGIGVKTTTDNDETVAIALQPSSAANDIIAVFVVALQRY